MLPLTLQCFVQVALEEAAQLLEVKVNTHRWLGQPQNMDRCICPTSMEAMEALEVELQLILAAPLM